MPLDRVPTRDAHAVPPAVGEVDRADEPARGVAAIAQEVGELGAPEPERIVCTVPAGILGVVLTRISSTGNDVAHADRVVVEKLMLEENAVAARLRPRDMLVAMNEEPVGRVAREDWDGFVESLLRAPRPLRLSQG